MRGILVMLSFSTFYNTFLVRITRMCKKVEYFLKMFLSFSIEYFTFSIYNKSNV